MSGKLDVVDVARPPAQDALVLAPRERAGRRTAAARPRADRPLDPRRGHASFARIQSATSGRYLYGMLLQTWLPSSKQDELALRRLVARSASCRSHGISRSCRPVIDEARLVDALGDAVEAQLRARARARLLRRTPRRCGAGTSRA